MQRLSGSPVILAPVKLRQADHEFQASLGYTVSFKPTEAIKTQPQKQTTKWSDQTRNEKDKDSQILKIKNKVTGYQTPHFEIYSY